MMSSKRKAILSFITVLLIGIAIGVVLENLVLDKKKRDHRRHDANAYLFKKFTTELSLTTAQQDTLQLLLDDIKKKHQTLGEKRRQEYDQIRKEFETEFRKILTAEQVQRYDDMIQKFEDRMKNRRGANKEKQRDDTKKGED